MNRHVPPPWKYIKYSNSPTKLGFAGFITGGELSYVIAEVPYHEDVDNSSVLETAPEMLAVLKMIRDEPMTGENLDIFLRVIAKAEGNL